MKNINLNEKDYNILIDIFKTEYFNNINFLKNYKSKNKKDNINFSFNKINYNSSHIIKYIKLLIIQNDFTLFKNNFTCTVLKIIRNEKIINFAYVYGYIKDNKNINKYIITSNSLISKDGEYKHRLININKLLINNKVINKIYNYIIKELDNKEFKFGFEIFNIFNKSIKKNYIKELSNEQFYIKIYIITWICELYALNKNDQEINKNETYNSVVFSNKDIDVFNKFYKKYKNDIDFLNKEFIYYDSKVKLELGQKLIPFNYIQLKEYNNIIHFQWKELLINKIITNILINSNSPCFSLFCNWFLIQNSNKCLYDNEDIYKKILYSDKIKEILNYLYLIKNNLINLKTFNEKEKIISNLQQRLNKIISVSESTMLMSNISLCYFSEYSGKTIYDYLIKLKNNQINPKIGNIFNDYDIFSKYLFEIIYSLYCLNLKGIIHGDLHLNNITFSTQDNIINQNLYIVYDLNNNINNNILNYINNYHKHNDINIKDNYIEDCYIFKNNNTYPTIIDYSRSFILINLIDEHIIEQEKNKIRDTYIKIEKKRMINELNKIFPNYIKNNAHKIKFLFKNKNFNILFIYFSAYDIFTFSTNLLIFLKKITINSKIIIDSKIMTLLNNISKKAYYYLEQIIDENNYDNENKNVQFPNYLIIEEFFKEFIMTKNKLNYNINNLFNLNNINSYNSLSNIRNILKSDIINYNNLNNINNIINNFDNIINTKLINDELYIEKVINNEYYKIKGNLHAVTSSIDNNIDNTFDATTNSINLSNY